MGAAAPPDTDYHDARAITARMERWVAQGGCTGWNASAPSHADSATSAAPVALSPSPHPRRPCGVINGPARDIAHQLSVRFGLPRRVVIIDTVVRLGVWASSTSCCWSHAAWSFSQGPSSHRHDVVALANHNPDVIVVDEIGSRCGSRGALDLSARCGWSVPRITFTRLCRTLC
jgi:hypothetical protein